jgi:hypothetical protein
MVLMILAPGSLCSSSFLSNENPVFYSPFTPPPISRGGFSCEVASSHHRTFQRCESLYTLPSPTSETRVSDSPGNYSFGFILKNRGFIIFLRARQHLVRGDIKSPSHILGTRVPNAPAIAHSRDASRWSIFQPTTELPNHMTPYHSCRRIIVCNFFLKSTRITRTPSQKHPSVIFTRNSQSTNLPINHSLFSIKPSILQLDIPSNVR